MASTLSDPLEALKIDPENYRSQEDARTRIAERGKKDLYFLCSVILGYNKLTPAAHGPFCRFNDTCNLFRRIFLMPRTHYKSTIKTIGGTIQWIVNDPNERILIAAATHDNASRFLEEIKRHFTNNQVFQWLYPEVIWDDFGKAPRWNKFEMEVPRTTFVREPTIDTIGARGEVVSRHYTKIVLDDIIGEQEYQSPAEMHKTCEWVTGIEPLLVPPWHLAQIDAVGTRWKLDDAYAFIEQMYGGGRNSEKIPIGPHAYAREDLGIFSRKDKEDGKPIFPEQFPIHVLEKLQRADPFRYAAQMSNDPLALANADFRVDWLRDYKYAREGYVLLEGDKVPLRLSDLETYLLCDPAIGKKKIHDRSVVHTVAVSMKETHRLILLDSFVGRVSPSGLIEEIFRQFDKWPQIQTASIEGVAYQAALEDFIYQKEELERRPNLPIDLYYPGIKDKTARIRGLQPLIRSGQLFVAQSGFSDFVEEYTRWHPQAKFQDQMDCLAQITKFIDFGEVEGSWAEMERYNRSMAASRNILTGAW